MAICLRPCVSGEISKRGVGVQDSADCVRNDDVIRRLLNGIEETLEVLA